MIAAPLALTGLLLLYLAWTNDPVFAYGLIPILVIGAVLYAFAPQIDWWYYQRRPPTLPAKVRAVLMQVHPLYRHLPPAQRIRFDQRLEMFRRAINWMPKGWPDSQLPPDVEVAISSAAVTVTFGKPDFIFEKFETVIVYPTAFPSPEYEFAHTSELYEPDGCLLLSAEHILKAFLIPGSLYNIALHEYAKLFCLTYPNEKFPVIEEETATWERLETVSRMSRMHIESVVGIPGVPVLAVAIHHYFTFFQAFRKEFPDVAAQFHDIFGLKMPLIFL